MAELADALDSGSSESNFMQVQVLFPAPKKKARQKRRASFFVNSGNGLEEAAMNQAPVGLENGADRAASSRENPVLFPAPKKKSSAKTGTVKYYAQIHLQVWQNSVCTGQGNLPLIT